MSHDATKRPCKLCSSPILVVRNQRTGLLVCLDVDSREHVFEVLDAAEGGDIADPVGDSQEVYVSHAVTCCGGLKP